MNKLIIIGNGFDLAHGLPTSYHDFISDFWKNLHLNYENKEIKEVILINGSSHRFLENPIETYQCFRHHLQLYAKAYGYQYDEKLHDCYTNKSRSHPIFKFENDFLKKLNIKNSIENWVDVENEYYLELKRVSKRRADHYQGNREEFEKDQIENNLTAARKLNKEFSLVKELFEAYLHRRVALVTDFSTFDGRCWKGLYDYLRPISIYNNETKLVEEFQLKEDSREIKNLFDNEIKKNEKITSTKILNFNYTPSTNLYMFEVYKERYAEKIIHIHGQLNNPLNPINFGFGDEMDEDYKSIENLNDNEYLKNFKSFKYSQNSNYKNLLDYIDSKKFQVYIMGHSCGLSDRTLLNTIFEHKYCRSIKVFYHIREDGSDNFTEIIQNISRHFNDKKMMRSKIVNKSLCVPLPQSIRFQKIKD